MKSPVRSLIRTFLCCLLVLIACVNTAWGESARELRASISKPFDVVVDELDFAITEHNFRITGRNAIGEAIRKLGYSHFPLVEVIHFCNLEYARQFLEIDPHFAIHMPCRIVIYEANGQVVVSTLLLPEHNHDPRLDPLAREMNKVLQEIIDFLTEKDSAALD